MFIEQQLELLNERDLRMFQDSGTVTVQVRDEDTELECIWREERKDRGIKRQEI